MSHVASVAPFRPCLKFFSAVPKSEFSDLLFECWQFVQSHPHLLRMIESDQDSRGTEKKMQRIQDQLWLEDKQRRIPGFELAQGREWLDDLELRSGRPRMPAEMVAMFMFMRGYLGGVRDRTVATFFLESRTLEVFLQNQGYKMPGASTIIENTNAVSNSTREAFLNAQIKWIINEGLDDFKKLTFDSTKVDANSAWPTDSWIIKGLVFRSLHCITCIEKFGVTVRLAQTVEAIAQEINELNKTIQFTSGKKNSAKKRAKLYRLLLRRTKKILQALEKANDQIRRKIEKLDILPSQKRIVEGITERLTVDVNNIAVVIDNTSRRINRNEKIAADEKVLSLSDEDAAMIVKGGREPALGFKPQLGRSEDGFVTALIVPQGNVSDSGQLQPIVDASIRRTDVLPESLSFDDGYTNTEDWEKYIAAGVKTVSFSGSKGKHIIPKAIYESDAYREARNDRSAIESLMFTIKYVFGFGELKRRGLENARAELLEKVLVYNFFRIILVRQKRSGAKRAA